MKEIVVDKYVRMFDLLNIEAKIDLLAKLTENIKNTFKKAGRDKKMLLESLNGSWQDIDESIVSEIYQSRTTSHREVDFD